MKTKPFSLILSFFIIAFLLTACKDEELPILPPDEDPNQFISTESLFDCSHSQVLNEIIPRDRYIYDLHRFGDYFVLEMDGSSLWFRSELDGENLKEIEFNSINGMVKKDGLLIICTFDGIYTIDQALNIEQRTDIICSTMEISPSEEILIRTYSSTVSEPLYFGNIIYEYNLTNNEITPFTEPFNLELCSSIQKFIFVSEENIWATSNCEMFSFLRFENKQFKEYYTIDNSPIRGYPADMLFLPYGNDMITVLKNGIGFYQVLKFTNNDWIVLKEFGNAISTSAKDIEMTGPSIVDAIIKDDRLFVSTTIAGCRGMHWFDISKNEALQNEDYGIVQDPMLPSQCMGGLYVDETSKQTYVITSQRNINVLTCN